MGNFTLLCCKPETTPAGNWDISPWPALEAQRDKPQIMMLPAVSTAAGADVNITNAKSTAKSLGAKIYTDTDGTRRRPTRSPGPAST